MTSNEYEEIMLAGKSLAMEIWSLARMKGPKSYGNYDKIKQLIRKELLAQDKRIRERMRSIMFD